MKKTARFLSLMASIAVAVAARAPAQEPVPAAAGEHVHPASDRDTRPEWAAHLTPEQARLALTWRVERLRALAAIEPGRASLRQAREVQRQFEQKLATILSPEDLSLYRATLPSALAADDLGKLTSAAELCNDGYTQLERACAAAVVARDKAEQDNDRHGGHNAASRAEYRTSAWVKKYSCEARDIAAVARTDCFAADDAAARAAEGIPAAQQQFEYAIDAFYYCWSEYDHDNPYAEEAAQAALTARNWLLLGEDTENECYACCTADIDAPGATAAFAQNPGTIRITWQDRSAETHFELQKSVNGAGYVTIATLNAEIEAYTDGAGSAEANNRYRVRALNTDCELQGPWSPIAVVPKAPNNLTYTRNGNTATLNWNDRSTLETNFEIHRKLGSQPWGLFLTVPANTESKLVNLQPGVNRFRVLAKTPTGKSWFTNEITITN